MQSSSQIVTTNKPTPNVFTGQMPFLSPNQQCQSTEGRPPETRTTFAKLHVFSSNKIRFTIKNKYAANT